MFKHILLPTDGSPASEAAIRQAVRFASETGARVTGFYAAPEFHTFTYKTEMLEDTREQYRKDSAVYAQKYLDSVDAIAKEAGVPCESRFVFSDHPYEAIIAIAAECGCDMIAMASHGRRGVKGMLIGSETQKVLTHTTIPVLVYR